MKLSFILNVTWSLSMSATFSKCCITRHKLLFHTTSYFAQKQLKLTVHTLFVIFSNDIFFFKSLLFFCVVKISLKLVKKWSVFHVSSDSICHEIGFLMFISKNPGVCV